jgi:hypothetical protein
MTKLFYEIHGGHEEEEFGNKRRVVIGTPNLYSLKADIDYGPHSNKEDMALAFNILSNSPNIRELELSIGHSGCVVSGSQPYAFDFDSNPLARFPHLTSLKLSAYDFKAR